MPPTPELTHGKLIARVAAGAALTMSSGNASASLDKFGSWFLAAFGAGLALILSHLKEVSAVIPLSTVNSTIYFFLVATVACVAQKYLSTIIVSGATSAKEGAELAGKHPHMDAEEFLQQMLFGMPRFVRWIAREQFDAMRNGDFAVGGKMFMRLAILHSILVSLELIILLCALGRIVFEVI